jgi:hypothetical protein
LPIPQCSRPLNAPLCPRLLELVGWFAIVPRATASPHMVSVLNAAGKVRIPNYFVSASPCSSTPTLIYTVLINQMYVFRPNCDHRQDWNSHLRRIHRYFLGHPQQLCPSTQRLLVPVFFFLAIFSFIYSLKDTTHLIRRSFNPSSPAVMDRARISTVSVRTIADAY